MTDQGFGSGEERAALGGDSKRGRKNAGWFDPIPSYIWDMARGDEEAIEYQKLSYDEWLMLQHAWMLDRLAILDGSPLAIALRALDSIARLAVNGSSLDACYRARWALEKTGGWAPKDAS